MTQPAFMRSAMTHLRTPLYLNAYALIASNVITSALGIVYWSLAAHMYSVEDVGIGSAVIYAVTFLAGISQLNLRMALIRLVPAAGARTPQLIWGAYGLSLAVTAVVSLVVFGAIAAMGGDILIRGGLTPALVLFLVLATMATTIFNMQDGVLAGLRRTTWVPVENGLYSVAKIILLVALAVSLPTLGIITSWFVPVFAAVALVTVAIAWRWLPAHVIASAGRSLEIRGRQLLRFVAADYVGALFALATSSLLPVIIVAGYGPRNGAYFAIVWTIATSLNLLPINMCASLTVETVHSRANLAEQTRRVAVHMLRIIVPMVIGIVLLADWILKIFGPDYSANGAMALRLLALALLPVSVNTLFMATSRIRGRGREILIVQAALAITMLAGTVVVIGPLGTNGVAAMWLVAQSAVALIVGTRRLWPMIAGGQSGQPAGAA